MNPTVAFDGTRFVVTWFGFTPALPRHGIYAARVDLDGTVVDAPPIGSPIEVCLGPVEAFHPSIACDDGQCLVAWYDTDSCIWGAYFSGDTATVMPAFRISSDEPRHFQPRVAWTGSGYVVAWTRFAGSMPAGPGAVVFSAFAPGETTGTAPMQLSTGTGLDRGVGLACISDSCLATWTEIPGLAVMACAMAPGAYRGVVFAAGRVAPPREPLLFGPSSAPVSAFARGSAPLSPGRWVVTYELPGDTAGE